MRAQNCRHMRSELLQHPKVITSLLIVSNIAMQNFRIVETYHLFVNKKN